jgi:hypothetical protein
MYVFMYEKQKEIRSIPIQINTTFSQTLLPPSSLHKWTHTDMAASEQQSVYPSNRQTHFEKKRGSNLVHKHSARRRSVGSVFTPHHSYNTTNQWKSSVILFHQRGGSKRTSGCAPDAHRCASVCVYHIQRVPLFEQQLKFSRSITADCSIFMFH